MAASIKDSLIALLDGIKRSDGETVAREVACLDALALSERDRLSPRLAHFLGNRSYAKALAHIQNGAESAGEAGGAQP